MPLGLYYDRVEVHREEKMLYARFLVPHRPSHGDPLTVVAELWAAYGAQVAAAVSGSMRR